jgi:hypothetical protein
MFMKKAILSLGVLMLCGLPILRAQSLTPQVYASSGAHYSSAGAQLSFTIGEPLTSSYTGASVSVTQGFHQPENGSAGISENEDFVFNVYPNPTQNYVTISTTNENIQQYQLDLIDQLGQVVKSQLMQGNNQQVDVSTFAAGNYHLRLTYLKNQVNSFTIIKVSNQ